MPIQSCTLPDGKSGYRWGKHGKCYADRADAEKQAEAAHANGYAGDAVLAFDRASVRSKDVDGRLHVEITPISKANVCPYLGEEIPGYEELGLDADTVYQLLRDPDELKKAAATFNNLPILSKHVPVSVDDYQPDLIVGSTGTDAEWKAPYLCNSLVIWAADAIEGIESDTQRELSSAYRYTPDMMPGVYEGERYDGVMRDIQGNHVALVETGRAGPDVVVGDSAITEQKSMSKPLSRHALVIKGALHAALKPKLAADQMPDLNKILQGVTATNWSAKKPSVLSALGQIAQDSAVKMALDEFPLEKDEEDDKKEEKDKTITDPAEDEDPMDGAAERIANLEAAVAKLIQGEKAEGHAEDEEDGSEKKEDGEKKDKSPAMDAAFVNRAVARAKTEALAEARAIREAERAVAPLVGELAVAMDSADDIYRYALEQKGILVKGVHPSAFPAMVELVKDRSSSASTIAQDSANTSALVQKIPGLARFAR